MSLTKIILSPQLASRINPALQGALRDEPQAGFNSITSLNVALPVPLCVVQEPQTLCLLESWANHQDAATTQSAPWVAKFFQDHSLTSEAFTVADYLGIDEFLAQATDATLVVLRAVQPETAQEIQEGKITLPKLQTLKAHNEWEVLDEIWPPNASTHKVAKPSTSKLWLNGLEQFEQLVQLIHTLGFVPVSQEMIRSSLIRLGVLPRITVTRETEIQLRHRQPGATYLSLHLTEAVLKGWMLRSVHVEATAHDQGWVDNRNGGSWTYADLVVSRDGIWAGSAKHSSNSFSKLRLYTNKIADSRWQDHSVKLGEDEPLVQFANKLAAAAVSTQREQEAQRQRLQVGEGDQGVSPSRSGCSEVAGDGGSGLKIELKIKALFSGWVHHVKRAAITVELVPL